MMLRLGMVNVATAGRALCAMVWRRVVVGVVAIGVAALVVGVAGCERDLGAPDDDAGAEGGHDRLAAVTQIVVTAAPLADLTRRLTDRWADVHQIVPSGADLRTWSLSTEDAKRVADADVLVLVGAGLDEWVLEALPDRAEVVGAVGADRADVEVGQSSTHVPMIVRFDVVLARDQIAKAHRDVDSHAAGDDETLATNSSSNLSTDPPGNEAAGEQSASKDGEGVAVAASAVEETDPFLWTDPVLVDRFVHMFGQELAPLFPDHAQPLRMRYRMLRQSVQKIDMRFKFDLVKLRTRRVMVVHTGLSRWLDRYDFDVIWELDAERLDSWVPDADTRLHWQAAQDSQRIEAIIVERGISPDLIKPLLEAVDAPMVRFDLYAAPGISYEESLAGNLVRLVDASRRE